MESIIVGSENKYTLSLEEEKFDEDKGITLLLFKKKELVAILPPNCLGFASEDYYPVYYKENDWVCQNYDSTSTSFKEEIIEELSDKDILRIKCNDSIIGTGNGDISEELYETGALFHDPDVTLFILDKEFDYIPLEDSEILLADGTIIEFDDAIAI